MPEPDIVALLARLAGAERVAAEPAGVARLVELSAGLPLVARIIGVKLDGLRHLPVSRFADRLDAPGRRLDLLSAGDLTVRERFALAYADLDVDERMTVRALVTHPGPASAYDLAAALGVDPMAAELAAERLIEAGVVAIESAEVESHMDEAFVRYAVCDLLREALLDSSDEDSHGGETTAIPRLDPSAVGAA
jgi:hypothetical protein